MWYRAVVTAINGPGNYGVCYTDDKKTADVTSDNIRAFYVGQNVEAKWTGSHGGNMRPWYSAVVTAIHAPGDYGVRYTRDENRRCYFT